VHVSADSLKLDNSLQVQAANETSTSSQEIAQVIEEEFFIM
jgi:hypothetical protein